jgi:hypothetical protein
MIKPNFLIFLDFDGVIKHKPTKTLKKACVLRVNKIARFLDANIVISSSWRLLLNWKKLNPQFDNRIIGITPDLEGPSSDNTYIRYQEILAFLEEKAWPDILWLALDDESAFFPNHANVYYTNPETLITEQNVENIISCQGKIEGKLR